MPTEKKISFAGMSLSDPLPIDVNPHNVRRVFLLSPANVSGTRAQRLFASNTRSVLAVRMRDSGVTLGEVFSYISSLYFRGKLSYAERFATKFSEVPGIHIITPASGLLPPHILVNLEQFQLITTGSVDENHLPYRQALERDAKKLFESLESDVEVALLGSIATSKYVEPLLQIFGRRLVFPEEFVGRGDMSRGGLLLRCVRAGTALNFIPVLGATHHGSRPPKLPKQRGKKKSAR
jgi:hypothetical protein